MIPTACAASIAPAALLAWWLDEVDAAEAARIDEHLFGCEACAAELQSLVDLAGGIGRLVRQGRFRAVVTHALPERLAAAGLRVREYDVACNGSVLCTIAPDDDVVFARMQAPLAGVSQLDLLILDPGGNPERLRDVPFNAAAGEVVLAPNVDMLRALPATTLRMQLVAVGNGSDRLIGEYAFHHTPWHEEPPA